MMEMTPNLGLALPPDGDREWGDKYRDAMRTLDAAVGGSGQASEIRLDYADRTDDSPVYLGKAPAGALDTDPVWTVTTLVYESSAPNARLVSTEVRTDIAWTGR